MTGPERPELADLDEAAASLTLDDPAVVGSTYGRTDYDNARRLALYEARNLRYVNDHDEWFTWCGTRWCKATVGDKFNAAARVALRIQSEAAHVEDDDERARHVQWAQQSLAENRLRSLMNVATGIDELRTTWDVFNARDELNFPNCTLDPLTLATHAHDRDDMLTHVAPTTYDPDATSPLLDAFLERFIPDDKERDYTLQAIAVAALSRGNAARKLIMLLGPTSTGKSTLMELVQKTLGRDYVAAVNPSVFRGNLEDKPRPDLLRTVGTRLVLAFEASERWELHADQIKRMTGGDAMSARGMRSNVIDESVATFVPIIVANRSPVIHGSDDALRRRLMALVMDTPIAEDDDDGSKRAELTNDEGARRALLARLVHAYHAGGGRVTLPIPPRFADKTMELFAALDDVDEVLRELKDEVTIFPAPEGTPLYHCVLLATLYRCYAWYVDHNGTTQQKRDRVGARQFAQRLRSLGYETDRSAGMRVVGWCLGASRTTNLAQI